MRDELEAPFLDEWLHDTEATPPDPSEGARRVASQLPHVRQAGRWLPFSLFGRQAQAPTDTTEYQPSPIPASNGHTPTVIGRTTSMLSPVKAITAGAIVFAISGAFLIAQPFGQQSSVPGAATDSGPVPPVEFSGRWVYSYTIEDGDSGGTWAYVAEEMSDPRLAGRISLTGNSSVLANGATVWSSAYRIENEEGAWQEVPGMLMNFGQGIASTRTGLLEGEGSYAGLVAIADLAWDLGGVDSAFDVQGIVIDAGDLPPTVTLTGDTQ